MEDIFNVEYEQIIFRDKITAQEAREIKRKNTVSEEVSNMQIILEIYEKIRKEANEQGDWIDLPGNSGWINDKIKDHFESLGFKVEFKKRPSLMDQDTWRISWE